MIKRRLLLFLLAAGTLFYGCSSAARFTGNKETAPRINGAGAEANSETNSKGDIIGETILNPDEFKDAKPLEVEIGVASYYADKYDGRPTASGVIYDMNKISAAHPFDPLGTIVRVTNLANNKSVILEINDRMPYRPDRIMDLSLGAAKALDMVIVGIQKVKLEVLKWGEGKRIERIQNPF